MALEGGQGSCRDAVRGGEHAVDMRVALQQGLHTLQAGDDVPGSVAHGDRWADRIKDLPVAHHAVHGCGIVLGAGQDGDPASPAGQEVVGRHPGADDVVSVDVGHG